MKDLLWVVILSALLCGCGGAFVGQPHTHSLHQRYAAIDAAYQRGEISSDKRIELKNNTFASWQNADANQVNTEHEQAIKRRDYYDSGKAWEDASAYLRANPPRISPPHVPGDPIRAPSFTDPRIAIDQRRRQREYQEALAKLDQERRELEKERRRREEAELRRKSLRSYENLQNGGFVLPPPGLP